MKYLIDITGRHLTTKATRIFRITDSGGGYRTAPTDNPPNVLYYPLLANVGEYRANLFGTGGRTNGVATVDRGDIRLTNVGGRLDEMQDYAFDGYEARIWGIDRDRSPYASRKAVATATIDQVELELDEIKLKLRSRLALLDQPLQEETYKGTTVAGGMDEAEGTADLKGSLRALSYGAPRNVSAILLNGQAQIHAVGHRFASIGKVRIRGGVLPLSGQSFETIQALRTATVPDGQVAIAPKLGLIRTGGNEARAQITVDAVEGATAAERTAGQIARRILIERAKLVENVDFRAADIAALDAVAPYEIGLYVGQSRMTILAAVSGVLDSVGGWISPDRLGVFRMGRFTGPAAIAKKTFTALHMSAGEGRGLRRLPIGEDGKGIPPKKITLQHSRNYTPVSKDTLAGSVLTSDPAFVEFAINEWRQEFVEDSAIADLHKGSSDILMQSLLVSADAARAELARRAALLTPVRQRWEMIVFARYALDLELGDTVAVQFPRYGLGDGRRFVVTGLADNWSDRVTRLDLWG